MYLRIPKYNSQVLCTRRAIVGTSVLGSRHDRVLIIVALSGLDKRIFYFGSVQLGKFYFSMLFRSPQNVKVLNLSADKEYKEYY